MTPITWITVAELLVKYGPEVADFIISRIHAGSEVTPEEWIALRQLSEQTPETQLRAALVRLGVPEQNEHVQNLLAMLPK